MPSNDCITFYKGLPIVTIIEPVLGGSHCNAVRSDSPDLPAGPTALALRLAQLAQPAGPSPLQTSWMRSQARAARF